MARISKIIILISFLMSGTRTVCYINPVTVYQALVAVAVGRNLLDSLPESEKKINKPINPQTTEIPGMAGTYDENIGGIMSEWQEDRGLKKDKSRIYPNGMILCGPSGNGKSTIAEKFAEQVGAIFIPYSGASIMTQYSGSGPQVIKGIFAEAIQKAENTGKRVVIFFDELDGIAGDGKGETFHEHVKTQSELWQQLDKYKDDNRIFVIGATNNAERLDKRLQNRFAGAIIDVLNPNENQREAVFKHWFKQRNGFELETICSGYCKSNLIKMTEGFSNREIEQANTNIRKEVVLKKADRVTPALIEKVVQRMADELKRAAAEEEKKSKAR